MYGKPHTVLNCKVIDPQATTSSYVELESSASLTLRGPKGDSVGRTNKRMDGRRV